MFFFGLSFFFGTHNPFLVLVQFLASSLPVVQVTPKVVHGIYHLPEAHLTRAKEIKARLNL
jgi:hypothetical protein